MINVVPTLHSDDVTTHEYDLLFDMFGPEGEETYRFEFRFNVRMDRWVLSIFNSEDRLVVRGAPIVFGVNLLSYAVPGLSPRGVLAAIWKTEAAEAREPGERDLGAWCDLVYFERAEDLEDIEPTDPPKA